MTKNNMELWDSVCNTDPKHTKHVSTRGGFTAIDAMYQVQEATKIFGPVGIGWGWDFELIFPQNDTVIAKVKLWHGNMEQTVSQVGQKALNRTNGPDEDAVKKAVTDGLTKCLSYLGFNADVFLGKFDDNKYVEAMKAKYDPSKLDPNIQKFHKWSKDQIVILDEITTEEQLKNWLKENESYIGDSAKNPLIKAQALVFISKYQNRKAEITSNQKQEA